MAPENQRRDTTPEVRENTAVARIRALAATLAPGFTAITLTTSTHSNEAGLFTTSHLELFAWILGGALLAGTLLWRWSSLFGRLTITITCCTFIALLLPTLLMNPIVALAVSLLVLSLLVATWRLDQPRGCRDHMREVRSRKGFLLGLYGGTLITAAVIFFAGAERGPVLLTLPLSSIIAASWTAGKLWRSEPKLHHWLLISLLASLSSALIFLVHPGLSIGVALGSTTALTLAISRRSAEEGEHLITVDWSSVFFGDPARSMVLTFLLCGFLGGWLLALPLSVADGEAVALIDGLFTAFSAVCVTGLAVLDTPTAFSFFGQGLILLLIQVGGLGIMTFSTAGYVLLGRRMTLKQELAAATLIGSKDQAHLASVLRNVFRVTGWAEGLGALALTVLFLGAGDDITTAIWRGLFTAISAFCNAGFALQTTSLMPYQDNPLVLFVVDSLIIAGGLGPVVVIAIPTLWRPERLRLIAKIVLTTSSILIAFAFLFILAAEWGNGLNGLSPVDKISNALFQAVTLRTAGFNSVDLTAFHPATLTIMVVMMFIGGSPGSTAGGVKTTTIAVLYLVLRAAILGQNSPTISSARLSRGTVQKASAVATLGLVTAIAFLVMLLLTQSAPFLTILFETVSALGTVGLSIGGTAALDGVGKALVIAMMFIGRVGPLTLFLFLSGRQNKVPAQPPERELPVG